MKIKKIMFCFSCLFLMFVGCIFTTNIPVFAAGEINIPYRYFVVQQERMLYLDDGDFSELIFERGAKISDSSDNELSSCIIIRELDTDYVLYCFDEVEGEALIAPEALKYNNIKILTSDGVFLLYLSDYNVIINPENDQIFAVDVDLSWFDQMMLNPTSLDSLGTVVDSYTISNSFYFSNLNSNMGINDNGSCTYVALSSILGYYDIFVNNNIVQNNYEGKNFINFGNIINSYDTSICNNSPGVSDEFHDFIIQEIGVKEKKFHALNESYALTRNQGMEVMGSYLTNYSLLNETDYTIGSLDSENAIIQKLNNNIPVILGYNSWGYDVEMDSEDFLLNMFNYSHMVIAYGYEILNDGTVYYRCNLGWQGIDNTSDVYVKSYSEIEGFYLELTNVEHICSDAYINSISSTEEHHFCASCGAIFIDEVALNCQTEPYEDSLYLQQNQTIIYELDLECDTRYDFEVESPNLLSVGLYDENMTLVSEFLYIQGTNNNYYYFNVQDLEEGRYHIKVNLASGSSSCNINVTLDHRPTSPEEILVNEPVDVLEHLHYSSNAYYFMRNKPGIYEVVLTGISSNGTIIYPEGTITIVSGDNVVQKYVFTEEDYDNPATSLNGSNTMTWLVDDYANYYINIEISSTGLTSLQLEVRELDTFTLSASDEFNETSQLVNGDKFEILDVERTGEYNLQATYNGSQTDDMLFVILRKNSDGLFEEVDGGLFNNTTNFETDVLLNTGEKIYIGYFNGNGNGTLSLNIERNVNNTFSLMTDPNGNVTVGSEVSLNNGEYGGTTLTQGYTRIVYLGIDAPYIESRTQYNWYTTDSSVAIVSAYGTVTATAAWTGNQDYKTVVIRAVYKSNPTIVGEITLTVYKETNTAIEVLTQYGMDVRGDGSQGTEVTVLHESQISIGVMPDVEIHKGYTRYICLGSDSPSNIIQNFTWSIDRKDGETGNATVSQYGVIKGITEGDITIKGVYKYNPRYIIYITVKIV